jgi:hypothetical protein
MDPHRHNVLLVNCGGFRRLAHLDRQSSGLVSFGLGQCALGFLVFLVSGWVQAIWRLLARASISHCDARVNPFLTLPANDMSSGQASRISCPYR